MVRTCLNFDSERLTALRAELDQQTALLPAVLPSSDSVALVDHLTTVFTEADWTCTARCSGFVEAAPSTEPSGWEAFQSVLREESRPTKAQCDAQAKDSALSRLQADIDSIRQTTCLPPSRLAALTASSSDQHGHLQAVRCTVCHSLLLTAAFNNHLPRCRPCAPPSAVPSNSSHPSSGGRLASRPNSARGRAAAKKGKGRGRGSKKPPAGPSRFAMERGKTPTQRQTTPRPAPTDFDYQLPAHPSQQQQPGQQQHHHPLTEATASAIPSAHESTELPPAGMSGSQRLPAGMSSPPAARQHSRDTDAEQDRVSQERAMKRSRSAWTYAEHLRRSNPELDAVHDPMLPPRFPHNVTRMRCRNRTHSDQPPQLLCESHLQTSPQGLTHAAASPLAGKALPLRSSKQEGKRLLAPQQQLGASSTQRPGHQQQQQQAPHRYQQHTNGLQPHSPPTSSWQLPGSPYQGATKHWQDSACHSQQSPSASHTQHRSSAAVAGQKRLLHDYLPGAPQHSDQRRQQAAQLPPLHQSPHSPQQDAQTTAAAHGQQQQPALLQPTGRLPSGSFKFKGSAQHSMHGSASNHAKLYKPSAASGVQGEYAAQPAANDSSFDTSHIIELKPSNGFRIPKSKRQVSVNALARSSLGT